MSRTTRFLLPTTFLSISLALGLAGCRSNQTPAQPSTDDPASANLADASNVTQTASNENPPPPPADQGGASSEAPPPQDSGQYDNGPGYDQSAGYDDTAYDVASDPPPDLPDYDQPPCPGDNYLWTPGYWSYAQAGYYWVPGAWVMAPYVGSLWTPGYWGFYSGRYHWYHGYWGPHVGFYGGVNYGFGYGGNGYEGGYWRNNAFYYNTSVTRVNTTVIRNVYDYRVTNITNTRVSFNGGRGGLNYQPTPAQVAARNERHVAPLPVQRTVRQTAMQNRAQFASENHGRPQLVAESRPMNGGRTAPAPRAEDFHPAPASTPAGRAEPGRPAPESRPSAGTPAPVGAPRPQPGNGIRPQPGRPAPESRPAPQPNRSAPASRPAPQPNQPVSRPQPNRPAPESRPAPQPQPFNRPASRPQPENRPQPESRPAPQPSRPAPESRPAPPPQESRPQPESRPAPQARPESRPAPESKPAPPPKQQPRPSKPDDKHPQ